MLPPLRARGLATLLNPDAELLDFLAVIEGDPALTASVLRASNSAFSAPREPIDDARAAIIRIGLEAARQLTSAAIMRSQFEHIEDSGLNVDVFWRRQLAVGLLTEAFASADRLRPGQVRSAFTAGLLHRVGRLALAARSPKRYRSVVGAVRSGKEPLDAEQARCGGDAVLLTKHIAARWALPDTIAEALTGQDDADASGLARLIREAVEVAELLGFDEGFSDGVVDPAELSDDHPRAASLEGIGGADGLRERVDWFRQASGGQAEATLETPEKPGSPRVLLVTPATSVDRKAA